MKDTLFARRNFLKTAALAAPAFSLIASAEAPQPSAPRKAPTHPATPKLTLNVRDFGAKGDGTTKDTAAIQQAIDRCSVLGGGEVLVPAGNYLIGAIQLRTRTLLRLDPDATLTGSPDFDDYPVTQVRWEGKWIQGHTALIYANGVEDIGIVGAGKIIGNPALGGRPRPTSPLRHPALIEPINCSNIRLEGFSTSYHLMWSIHPTLCQNIVIKNLTIRSTGGNGDGIDIDSCQHVLIDHCEISTGDDCISLKSGRGEEAASQIPSSGNSKPGINPAITTRAAITTEDVTITNCTFADSIFACIGIGSETSGGIRNVRISNCKFTHARSFAFYIKTRTGRGAFIEDITATNLDLTGDFAGFLRIEGLKSGIQDQDPVPGDAGIPTLRNFHFSNIHVENVPVLVEATSIHPNKPLTGLTLTNVTGTCQKGIFLANVKNAIFRNIDVKGYTGALFNTYNSTGVGIRNPATIEAPKLPDDIPTPAEPYTLH
ncbi:hypothetical protein GCM10011507_25350 [Edaphobacter acidisoli]|uniref:Glycoside hydrolase n=1 Tax=Edaphobacter acidisoli TaxID=2040573 RepID=A0A916RVH5_9BACT|nr:glycosyl hydrolase family 28 protein [Edaphobacter acidisoli]GGA72675.1 hypothetical protein GCM10011507_25350 [Edaphobacter acidisoli]